ncbi:MAG: competence/damage-inducible protein A [Anaerolineae bacterium]|nr:competence/damage-inducible protein A [Gemmatimonadaceae bacterium]
MKIELITIGDELLLGFVVDTNAVHLARVLAGVGVEVVRRSTVPDEAEAIAASVREALDRTGGVVTTGGLGPTSDDMTKPAIAALFGRQLQLNEGIVALIEERFRSFGFTGPMPPGNRQQAMIPDGAVIIPNAHGTAPGIWIEDDRGRWVAMLPGVPREMRGMLADELLPMLRQREQDVPTVVLSRTLRTTGIGESALADLLGDDATGFPDLPLAYNPGWQGTELRLTARGMSLPQARKHLDDGIAKLYSRVERYVYAEETTDLAEVVLRLARARGARIATAESCTGGLLGARLTAIPGASDVYTGGIVAYDDAVKLRIIGVDPEVLRSEGAVSEAIALEMARRIAKQMQCDVGIGITGIAGPGGATPGKPVGTVWIAVQVQDKSRTHGRVFIGDREEIRLRATQAALDMTRHMLA